MTLTHIIPAPPTLPRVVLLLPQLQEHRVDLARRTAGDVERTRDADDVTARRGDGPSLRRRLTAHATRAREAIAAEGAEVITISV